MSCGVAKTRPRSNTNENSTARESDFFISPPKKGLGLAGPLSLSTRSVSINKSLTHVCSGTEGLMWTGRTRQGNSILIEFIAKYEGKDYPMTGSATTDTIALEHIDENTIETTRKERRGGHDGAKRAG